MDWYKNWTAGKHLYYRQRVADVKAFRMGHETEPDWFGEVKLAEVAPNLRANDGDWIVMDSAGAVSRWYHDQFIDHFAPKDEYAKYLP